MSDITQQRPDAALDRYIWTMRARLLGFGFAHAFKAGRGLVAISEVSNEPTLTYMPLAHLTADSDPALLDLLRIYNDRRQVVVGAPRIPEGTPYYRLLEWEFTRKGV